VSHQRPLGDPILKIPNTKMGWQSGSSGKVPVWKVWVPELKSQYHWKRKKEIQSLPLLLLPV
jgi:hypothetical protein